MSIKKHTQIEIGTFLKAEVPEIVFFDKYRGQLDNSLMHTFPMPAVFMSFGKFEWETMTGGIQRGTGFIKFRIAVNNYAESYEGSFNQDLALEFFEINQKIHEKLQGLSGTYFQDLDRKSDEDDEDHGNVIVTVMEYFTTLYDNSANVTKNFVLTDPKLIVDYKNKEDFQKEPPEDNGTFIISM